MQEEFAGSRLHVRARDGQRDVGAGGGSIGIASWGLPASAIEDKRDHRLRQCMSWASGASASVAVRRTRLIPPVPSAERTPHARSAILGGRSNDQPRDPSGDRSDDRTGNESIGSGRPE
jgi:hypothetical protein